MANGTHDAAHESEWLTRKRRIDPLLDAAGWPRRGAGASAAFRTEEEETAHGPAALGLECGCEYRFFVTRYRAGREVAVEVAGERHKRADAPPHDHS